MIQKILLLIVSEDKSLNEIASELHITTDALKERLDMLAHLGYLKHTKNCPSKELCSNDTDSDHDQKQDRKKNNENEITAPECKHCLVSKTCHQTSSKLKFMSGYILTTKGQNYIKQVNLKLINKNDLDPEPERK